MASPQKPLEKALKCFVKMIVLTMVRLASSDFWKAPLTWIAPVGSCQASYYHWKMLATLRPQKPRGDSAYERGGDARRKF